MSEPALLRFLREILGLVRSASPDPQLVGALAILIRLDPDGLAGDPTVVDPSDPSTLARVVEATQDIDLVVENTAAVESVLLAAGFQKEARKLVRFSRGGDTVDIIPATSSSDPRGPIDIPPAACSSTVVLLPGAGKVRVAAPGALVVLKACAWRDRHEPRDLADIGALGLGAAFLDITVDHDIAHACRLLRDGPSALDQVAKLFSGADANGPGAFYGAVLQRVSPIDSEAWGEQYEEQIRELVSDAVTRMLRRAAP